jgi:signal transduction histidine kinase
MLRHAPIRSKVVAILILPLAGLIALAAVGIGTTLARGAEAGRRNDLAQLAVRGNTLVHELQAERTLSSDWVAARPSRAAVPRDGMLAQRVVVNRTRSALGQLVGRLDTDAYDPRVRQALDRALGELRGLPTDREAIDSDASSPTAAAVEATYSAVVSALLDLNAAIAVGSDDEALFRSVSSFVALSRLKDTNDLERGFRISQLLVPDPEQRQLKRFISFVTERESWLAQLRLNATPEQLSHYEASIKGPEVSRITRTERAGLSGSPAELRAIGTGEELDRIWFAAMTERVNKLRRVEREFAAHLLTTSRSVESSANRQTVMWLAGMAALLLVTLVVSLLIARSLIEPLRNLQDTAEGVARELPQAVEQIQRLHEPNEGAMPAPGRARLLDASARDEISRVARSFNAAHEVAIRVASEQAALRRSIADMFQNLAQRSQVLVRRSLELVDELEKDETRPETLERLFQVDHLITRMRRNAENLIVLAGADLPNPWEEPVPLNVLIRSAIAEVEHYQRVEPLPMSDLEVVGHAAVDVIHLLAELIENATVFSQSDTRVTVAGTPAANGHVVEIEDKGIGMSDDELMRANQLLADPPAVDSALSQRLGLHVVARLAERHGLRIQLRHSWYNGVTALVLLPDRLLVYPATDTGAIGWGRASPPTMPGPRSRVAAPWPSYRLPWPGPANQPISHTCPCAATPANRRPASRSRPPTSSADPTSNGRRCSSRRRTTSNHSQDRPFPNPDDAAACCCRASDRSRLRLLAQREQPPDPDHTGPRAAPPRARHASPDKPPTEWWRSGDVAPPKRPGP